MLGAMPTALRGHGGDVSATQSAIDFFIGSAWRLLYGVRNSLFLLPDLGQWPIENGASVTTIRGMPTL
jgi:hypothetical protein